METIKSVVKLPNTRAGAYPSFNFSFVPIDHIHYLPNIKLVIIDNFIEFFWNLIHVDAEHSVFWRFSFNAGSYFEFSVRGLFELGDGVCANWENDEKN